MADVNLLSIDKGTVTAPAGCGKTHLIALALGRHQGPKPILVLTHTNAGVAALRDRLDRAGVAPAKYRLSTIDGWCMRLLTLFPKRGGHDPAILSITHPKSHYPAIRKAAAILLRDGHVNDVLAATYDRLIVDEYQDCAEIQHAIVYYAAVTRKRGPDGGWTYSYRPRSPATAEESIIALKAALKHNEKRLSHVPSLKHKTRDAVTSERTFRLSTETLAKMLDFTIDGAGNYAGHADRLLPFRRYLIAAISTVARPDAIFDMSVQPAREQWLRDHKIYALNPKGRLQTKKVRPVVPVTGVLAEWLAATDDRFVCREWDIEGLDGALEPRQQRVASIDSAWASACQKFEVPPGWGPKLIRHSVATILASKRVDLVELEIILGHRPVKKTTARYTIFDPDYLLTVRQAIEELWSELAALCRYPLHPNFTQEERRKRQSRARKSPLSH